MASFAIPPLRPRVTLNLLKGMIKYLFILFLLTLVCLLHFPWLFVPGLCILHFAYIKAFLFRHRFEQYPQSQQYPQTSEIVAMIAKISKTPPRNFIFDDETSCPICLEPLSAQDRILSPSCCHKVFHYDCLRKWLGEQSLTCPNDRTPVHRRSFIQSLLREDGMALREQPVLGSQHLTWDVS